jgi:hypothetical protein
MGRPQAKQDTPKPQQGAAAFTTAKKYPKRITLDLTVDQHKALKLLSVGMDVSMADRLREMVDQLVTDQKRQSELRAVFGSGQD